MTRSCKQASLERGRLGLGAPRPLEPTDSPGQVTLFLCHFCHLCTGAGAGTNDLSRVSMPGSQLSLFHQSGSLCAASHPSCPRTASLATHFQEAPGPKGSREARGWEDTSERGTEPRPEGVHFPYPETSRPTRISSSGPPLSSWDRESTTFFLFAPF